MGLGVAGSAAWAAERAGVPQSKSGRKGGVGGWVVEGAGGEGVRVGVGAREGRHVGTCEGRIGEASSRWQVSAGGRGQGQGKRQRGRRGNRRGGRGG